MTIGAAGPRRSRARDDRGTALIEAAIAVPVIMIIFFGLTQLAFAMSTSSSATGASRTGARLAAASYAPAATAGGIALSDELVSIRLGVERDLENRPSQATPVSLWVYKADANGNPTSGPTCSSDCIKWSWTGSGFGSPSGSWSNPDACGQAVDSIGVRVKMHHDISAPFLNDITVDNETTMRLEPITNASC